MLGRLTKTFFFLVVVVLYIIFLSQGTVHPPRIYDCFLFYNEFELLELRLEEMYPIVDKFVIVEAAETFRGAAKPLHFQAQKERFKKFSDKIIYIPVEGHFETDNPWVRERNQRDQILRGLKGCKRNDIILISDVDEIVRKEKMAEIAAPLISGQLEALVLEQKMYFGCLNRFQAIWRGTVATTYSQVKRLSPKNVRKLRHMKERKLRKSHIARIRLLENAGWHFSSIGGVDRYLDKIKAFSHAELDTEEFTRNENLLRLLESCPIVPIDESFPAFVQENQSRYRQIGFID